jgi:pseudaminic acid cytidylyltransferase
MNVAIIPARGGSKRIPRKNVKLFHGKPIIAYSIEAALKSGVFDRVIVSTDDDEIAEVARRFGATTPFTRPIELSDDHSGTHEVIGHAVRWLRDHGVTVESVCCIYATAPMITSEDIRAGLELLTTARWKLVFAATSFGYPIFRALKKTEEGGVSMFYPEHYRSRSQDLPEAFHDAGQFYWATASTWLGEAPAFGDGTAAVMLPRWRVQDIDTPDDWARAEMIFRLMQDSQTR